ncbi:Tetratricopeptide repeat-containing protein [Heracleum sosnowskyi]|uniref:Tetratricopeptide repeat-containing protein n=1 Tax=Heracleum sosnowskyi TaxID=360622 RepID=A0AAD8HMS0_9APIA|nr:Tetratricopeptide repeat-containing protein [Heracleum sosnowskyi]
MAIHKSSPSSHLLRSYELRLLRCSFSPSDLPSIQSQTSITSSPTPNIQTLANELLQLIESGEYAKALSSSALDKCSISMSLVVEGVCFNGGWCCDFSRQCNFTGPLGKFPLVPLLTMNLKEASDGDWLEWEIWARNELMITGSELQGKLSILQYIVFAKILLMRIKDWLLDESFAPPYDLQSISWWLVRLLLIQQKVLDGLSSYMFDLLQVFMRENSNHFGSMEKVVSYWGAKLPEEEAQTVVAMLHLEMGIVEHTYGRVDSSSVHFKLAEAAAGLSLSVSGALGFRTVHQVEPKVQLVLSVGGDEVENSLFERHHVTSDNSDILLTPRLVDVNNQSHKGPQSIPNSGVAILKAVQQAVILAQCLSIEKSSRHNEMHRWEMAPYIEAIDSQQSLDFILSAVFL